MRGATRLSPKPKSETRFQSTLPMRGATQAQADCPAAARISIHAPHAGSDWTRRQHRRPGRFQSTLPMRGATARSTAFIKDRRFQSTLPMRGATTDVLMSRRKHLISIHAPHAGSDEDKPSVPAAARISIHAPHAGSDSLDKLDATLTEISIHAPHAGSDGRVKQYSVVGPDFNPRSPCGERRPSTKSSSTCG